MLATTSRRASRTEERTGAVIEYRDLRLHAACLSGNLGLASWALEHGQPVQSVLSGVLPLHVAAGNGHLAIVQLLLKHGADVNAPRLSRKYSKERVDAAPGKMAVGTTGSTSLHFAAASGQTEVLAWLLSDAVGGDPTLTEKTGKTAEMLAREKGHPAAAELLRSWVPPRGGLSVRRATSLKGGNPLLHPQRSLKALNLERFRERSGSISSITSSASTHSSNRSRSGIDLVWGEGGAKTSTSAAASDSTVDKQVGRKTSHTRPKRPSTAPATRTTFDVLHAADDSPTPSGSSYGTPNSILSRSLDDSPQYLNAPSGSQQAHRSRKASLLQGGFVANANPASSPEVFEDDDDYPSVGLEPLPDSSLVSLGRRASTATNDSSLFSSEFGGGEGDERWNHETIKATERRVSSGSSSRSFTSPRPLSITSMPHPQRRLSRSGSASTDASSSASHAADQAWAQSSYAPSSSSSSNPANYATSRATMAGQLSPLYEQPGFFISGHDAETSAITTSAQAHSRVELAQASLMNYDVRTPSTLPTKGSDYSARKDSQSRKRPSLSEQLAEYGRSIALEKQLREAEQEESGYEYEVIRSSSRGSAAEEESLHKSSNVLAVPSSKQAYGPPQWTLAPARSALLPARPMLTTASTAQRISDIRRPTPGAPVEGSDGVSYVEVGHSRSQSSLQPGGSSVGSSARSLPAKIAAASLAVPSPSRATPTHSVHTHSHHSHVVSEVTPSEEGKLSRIKKLLRR